VARGAELRGAVRGWVLGGALAVVAVAAVVLSALALAHVRQEPPAETVAPVPTFGPEPTGTPTPTTAPPVSYDRSLERFVAVGDGVIWRGTAGSCGTVAPTLERSTDDGETWTDVAPAYLGIGGLVAVDAFAGSEAEIIATMGDECEVQLLRTFTQGRFWAPYPDVLAGASFVDPADAGSIRRPEGALDAPCDDARSLRGAALVCDAVAYELEGDVWTALPLTNVAAIAADDEGLVIAHGADGCDGVALTRYSPEGVATDAGCVAGLSPENPTALAISGDDAVLWSGDEWVVSTM